MRPVDFSTVSTRTTANVTTTAEAILAAASAPGGRNLTTIDTALRAIAATDPARAAATRTAIEAQLTPVERGTLARTRQSSSGPGDAEIGRTVADVTQIALDIAGIFDPTPISDGANTIISAVRGDWVGAGLSAVSIIPYVGDLAKLGKLGGWAQKVANAVDLAASSPAARAALEPVCGNCATRSRRPRRRCSIAFPHRHAKRSTA